MGLSVAAAEFGGSPQDPAPLLGQVAEALRSVEMVEASFISDQILPPLEKPLRKEGFIRVAPRRGIYQRLDRPLAQELLILPGELWERQPPAPWRRIQTGGVAEAHVMTDALLALLSGDADRWTDLFLSHQEGSLEEWRLSFEPRPKHPVAKHLLRIEMFGRGPLLDSLSLYLKGGSQETMRFSDQKIISEATAAQWNLFSSPPDSGPRPTP
ncbi:MAG: hypothetical protein IPP35_08020 [Elusimicrobia bacterium]|nr:hypothetical protein [Elusimicrobiota bacterium]